MQATHYFYGKRSCRFFTRASSLLFSSMLGLAVATFTYSHAQSANTAEMCQNHCTSPNQCIYDGLSNTAVGNAKLHITKTGHLIVADIGSSGTDGVLQDLPEKTTYMITGLAAPNFSKSVKGTKAEIDMIGVVNGKSGQLISRFTIENIDGKNMRITPDMSFVGATQYFMEVMKDDKTVANFKNLKDPSIVVPIADFKAVDCGIEQDGVVHISYEWTIDQKIETSQGSAQGNVFWIKTGPNPTLTATFQEQILNKFANTGPIAMTFQDITPAICPSRGPKRH